MKQTFHFSYWFDGVIFAIVLASQAWIYWSARRYLSCRLRPAPARNWTLLILALMGAALAAVCFNSETTFWPSSSPAVRAVGFAGAIWVCGSTGAALLLFSLFLSKKLLAGRQRADRGLLLPAEAPAGDFSRRDLLANAASAAAAVIPFGLAGYGTLLVRTNFALREVDFPVRALPPDLEGFRIALLSDIHFGAYLSRPELDRVVAMANEARPHVTLVTGDLITRQGDPLETCLDAPKRLRADAGVFGCLGNHEIYANCEDLTEQRARAVGIDFLRMEHRVLRFGQARLNLAGVDYQRQNRPYLVGAHWLVEPDAVNVLLSHNPDVFPVAASMGYDLVVGGHTHGGQVTVEILEQTLNASRFFTPYVAGLYRRDSSSLYVSRGIGTINLPMRLGARPEVALLRLRRA
jgi:predicted MPP superfamily phosphohydrolase